MTSAGAALRNILAKGPASRAQIAEDVGLSRSAMTHVVNRLLRAGLVHELAPVQADFGRPTIPLALSEDSPIVASVHLGATEVRFGLVNLVGTALREHIVPYAQTSPEAVVAMIVGNVQALLEGVDDGRVVLGAGLSIGGWVDTGAGRVVRYVPLDWHDVPLRALLESRLRLPVAFDHMVRGMALAEMMFGAARSVRDFLEVYVGNVIGAALVSDGRVRFGPRGAAGTVQRLSVSSPDAAGAADGDDRRPLEEAASDLAMVRQAVDSGVIGAGATAAELIAHAESGDAAASAIVDRRARRLGAALAGLVDFQSPELLVVAGSLVNSSRFQEEFESGIYGDGDRDDVVVPVTVSTLGYFAPTLASGAVFLNAFYDDPFRYV